MDRRGALRQDRGEEVLQRERGEGRGADARGDRGLLPQEEHCAPRSEAGEHPRRQSHRSHQDR